MTETEISTTCDDSCINIYHFNWNAGGNDCYNLNDEYVILENSCSYSCDLTDWTVEDDSGGKKYTLSEFVLRDNSQVTIYSGCGENENSKLYWCNKGKNCDAIWNNDGDVLYLRDAQRELVLEYTYLGYS